LRSLSHRGTFSGEPRCSDFPALDLEKTIVIPPVATIVQHGPHLPVMTGSAIGEAMPAGLLTRLPAERSVLVLPIQAIGKSNEYLLSPGTVSLSAGRHTCLSASAKALVLANSRGGNVAVWANAARELRIRFGPLAAAPLCSRFGLASVIHGGDIETALMLEFRPDLVHMLMAGSRRISMPKAPSPILPRPPPRRPRDRRPPARRFHRPVARPDRVSSHPSVGQQCRSLSLR
jgi:creatinine amidohydrolase